MNTKRILIIVVPLVLIMLVVGLYFLFSSPKTTTTSGQTGAAGTLPAAGTQSNASGTGAPTTGSAGTLGIRFGVISNEPSLDYFVDANNNTFSIQPDGEIDEVSNGQMSVLNSLTIQNIISAGFSYDGKKALVNFGDPSNPQTSVFDLSAKTWMPMNTGWQSPVWSPSDYRIAYATTNAANGTETFSTSDASKTKPAPITLLSLHAQDLSLAWPNKNQLMLETKPSALVAGSSWLLNLRTKALSPITTETTGLETLWGEGGTGTAMSTGLQFSLGSSEGDTSLQLIDAGGNILKQVKFITLPSKCAFTLSPTNTSTSYLYCGVPRDQSDLAFNRLPDDYNQMALFTTDDIYRINLSSGAVDTIFNDQAQSLDVSDLRVFNNTVFFINRYDQKLYAITLASGN